MPKQKNKELSDKDLLKFAYKCAARHFCAYVSHDDIVQETMLEMVKHHVHPKYLFVDIKGVAKRLCKRDAPFKKGYNVKNPEVFFLLEDKNAKQNEDDWLAEFNEENVLSLVKNEFGDDFALITKMTIDGETLRDISLKLGCSHQTIGARLYKVRWFLNQKFNLGFVFSQNTKKLVSHQFDRRKNRVLSLKD